MSAYDKSFAIFLLVLILMNTIATFILFRKDFARSKPRHPGVKIRRIK